MRRPAGFVALSIAFALAALEGGWVLVATTPYPESRALLAGRLLAAALCTLTGAVAVALWRCEPWAGRLVGWWAGAALAVSTLGPPALLSPFFLLFLALMGGMLLLLVRYVERRVAALRRPRRGVRVL